MTSCEHGFEPLLELAAIFRAGDQGAHVEGQELLVLQALGHVAVDDAQRQAFDDRRLADAGLADEHGIILGAPRQHLDGAADFFVAPDHRIELAVARCLGQVAGVFLQRIVGVLCRRAVGGAALAQGLDRRVQVLRRHACIGQNLSGVAAFLRRQRQQQPFDGDETVAGLFAHLLGSIEHPRQRRIEVNLPGPAAGDLRPLGERGLGRGKRGARIAAGAIDQSRGEPFWVVEQDLQQMFGGELLVSLALGERLGGLNETAAAVGIFLKIHGASLGLFRRPEQPKALRGNIVLNNGCRIRLVLRWQNHDASQGFQPHPWQVPEGNPPTAINMVSKTAGKRGVPKPYG